MWFTQVSLRNPVFATMVMLALVVLGLFSFQRLKIDQFPNIDLPVVVITTVIRITKVAPKVRASSLRMEEWNNIQSN